MLSIQQRKKANKELHASARIAKYLDVKKRKMLIEDFVSSQFSYYLLRRFLALIRQILCFYAKVK